jgi:hypothetical protein
MESVTSRNSTWIVPDIVTVLVLRDKLHVAFWLDSYETTNA